MSSWRKARPAQRRPGPKSRRHMPVLPLCRCSVHAQRRPGPKSRRHARSRRGQGSERSRRSTKAGTEVPATPQQNLDRPGGVNLRSTKAGTEVPATRYAPSKARCCRCTALNEGRDRSPGDTANGRNSPLSEVIWRFGLGFAARNSGAVDHLSPSDGEAVRKRSKLAPNCYLTEALCKTRIGSPGVRKGFRVSKDHPVHGTVSAQFAIWLRRFGPKNGTPLPNHSHCR